MSVAVLVCACNKIMDKNYCWHRLEKKSVTSYFVVWVCMNSKEGVEGSFIVMTVVSMKFIINSISSLKY